MSYIHGWIEVKINDKWTAIDELNVTDNYNYDIFIALYKVRFSDPNFIKGVPANVSDTVKYWIDVWGDNGNYHTWLYLTEFVTIFLKDNIQYAKNDLKYIVDSLFNVNMDILEQNYNVFSKDIRLVVWFDN